MIQTGGFHSSGRSESAYGVGSISISSRRRDNGHCLDIGEILYSNPDELQMEKAEEAAKKYSTMSSDRTEHEAAKASSGISRRLSLRQANYLLSIVTKALNEAMPDGVIPHDDDIPELR
jgi:ATP-dependent DNA ligase